MLPYRPDLTPRIPKGCAIVALTVLLAASGPQANAADFARPSDTITVDRQPQVPTHEGAPALLRHDTQTSDDDTSRVVKSAAIGTVITIIGAAGICVATAGAVCMFPLGF